MGIRTKDKYPMSKILRALINWILQILPDKLPEPKTEPEQDPAPKPRIWHEPALEIAPPQEPAPQKAVDAIDAPPMATSPVQGKPDPLKGTTEPMPLPHIQEVMYQDERLLIGAARWQECYIVLDGRVYRIEAHKAQAITEAVERAYRWQCAGLMADVSNAKPKPDLYG
jgi:hypothetical protein